MKTCSIINKTKPNINTNEIKHKIKLTFIFVIKTYKISVFKKFKY